MEDLRILVVDDEPRMRKLICDYLMMNGYKMLEAGDGEEALEVFFDHKNIDLILLDVMMPKLNGYEVTAEIRKRSGVPIIMLTAKDSERDELTGYQMGIDEYISKPFSPKILLARIEAILRRSRPEENQKIECGGIVMDKTAHTCVIDGKECELSYKEFELLCYFIDNKGIALSRENILNHVWNYDYYGEARTVDTHVKKLRSKIGDKGNMIKTIWGLGYKFEG